MIDLALRPEEGRARLTPVAHLYIAAETQRNLSAACYSRHTCYHVLAVTFAPPVADVV